MNMRRSSVASSLKQEQVDASKLEEGGLSNLELRLGISSDNGLHGVATVTWLGVGVHPWSMSSRQEKAAMEQAQPRVQREDRPPLVGWPPVRAFRKNLSTPRPAYSGDLKSKAKPTSEEEEEEEEEDEEEHHGTTGASGHERSTLFVKVNLQGYAIGRKIDINAHRGYCSLSVALQSMFHGFMSDGHGRIATCSREDDGEEHDDAADDDDEEKGNNGMAKKYILLYEDSEGDRMLAGDVPWELFIASVKRLYIAHDPRADHQHSRKKKNSSNN